MQEVDELAAAQLLAGFHQVPASAALAGTRISAPTARPVARPLQRTASVSLLLDEAATGEQPKASSLANPDFSFRPLGGAGGGAEPAGSGREGTSSGGAQEVGPERSAGDGNGWQEYASLGAVAARGDSARSPAEFTGVARSGGGSPSAAGMGTRAGLEPAAPPRSRGAARAIQNHADDLHPIIQLGWSPMCEVHCNGLTGEFLGGHDRDLYIRCTGPAFINLPLIDYSQGGCIMTCSQFEKVAGRELSKKWKESIHVLGEGEGSKATLVSWLKRRAEAEFGEGVVGRHAWVCWCADSENYLGHIISYNRETGKHKVRYSDRFVEELHLPVELLSFTELKPARVLLSLEDALAAGNFAAGGPGAAAPAPLDAVDGGGRAGGRAASGDAGGRPAGGVGVSRKVGGYSTLYAQGSGVSVTSAFDDDSGGPAARRPDPRKHRPRPRSDEPLRRTSGVEDDEYVPGVRERHPARRKQRAAHGFDDGARGETGGSDESDGSPAAHPPKRPRTGAPLSTSVTLNGGHHAARPLAHHLSLPSHWSARPPPLYPRPPSRVPDALRIPESPGALRPPEAQRMADGVPGVAGAELLLPPPPAAGYAETNVRTISRWMNSVVLAMDDMLQAAAQDLAPVAGIPPADPRLSVSGRFQTLLVFARKSNCIHGYYEAMLTRYESFRSSPPLLSRKMREFVFAALHEDGVQHARELAILAADRKSPEHTEVADQFASP